MGCIFHIKDNFEGYLKLCDLKLKIFDCIYSYDKIFVNIYLRRDDIKDYNLYTLEIILKNLRLSYNECIICGFSERISLFLTQAIESLKKMYYEMKNLLEEYPYLDDEINISDIVDDLKMSELEMSDYPFVNKYLGMKKLMDDIVLYDIYDYKKTLCYKQNIFCIKK